MSEGRVRRDPRDRSASGQPRPSATPTAAARIRDTPDRHVMVALVGPIQGSDATLRLLGLARTIARDNGVTWVLGADPSIDYAALGADRLALLPALATASFDLATALATVLELDQSHRPAAWLFPDSVLGREAAARFAAATGAGIAANVVRVRDDKVIAWSNGREFALAETRILVIEPSHFPAPTAVERAEARVIELPVPTPLDLGIEQVGGIQREPSAYVPLEEAPLIVAVGQGVRDIARARALADQMGAAFGATRPVCDAGLVERTRQIGASGRRVAPDLYLALGISGAQQHLDGIVDAAQVIAVNIDARAPIMARADIGLCADVQETLHALGRRLDEGS